MAIGWIIGAVILVVIIFLVIKAIKNYKKVGGYRAVGGGAKGFFNACCGRGRY